MLLAVVSKNDPEPVDEVLTKHPIKFLRPDDFVRVVADWGNKVDHIRALADDLSLALDTFVLLDDNPFERSLVESELPYVVAPDFPTLPGHWSDWFLSEVVPSFFPRVRVLDEDRAKTSQYHSREGSDETPRRRISTTFFHPSTCASPSGSTTST